MNRMVLLENQIDDFKRLVRMREEELGDVRRRAVVAEHVQLQMSERISELLQVNNQFEQRAREAERRVAKLEDQLRTSPISQQDIQVVKLLADAMEPGFTRDAISRLITTCRYGGGS